MKNSLNLMRFSSLCLCLFLLAACGSSSNSNKEVDPNVADNNKTATNPDAQNPEPVFQFNHTDWDFGNINEGEKVKHTFKFTNVGNEDLVIGKCSASCGCTVPNCDKRPIPPGGTGEIPVAFDSNGKPGNQIKTVTIIANTNPPTTELTFRAQVAPQ